MPSLNEKAIKAIKLQDKGQILEAESIFHEILAEKPDHAESLNGLGIIMAGRDQQDLAMKLIRAAIDISPMNASYYNNLGTILSKLKRYDDALLLYEEALKRHPDSAETLDNLGAAFCDLGRYDEAIATLEASFKAAPNRPETHYNIGLSFLRSGRYREAEHHFRRGAKLAPGNANLRWNYAITLLLSGNFRQGWKEADWRIGANLSTRPKINSPLWTGQSLKGKTILVHCEQGLGDSIQFVRFLPLLKAKGAAVILASPPLLLPLFQNIAGADRVYYEKDDIPPHDLHASLLDLPLYLEITEDTIPAPVPYLTVDPAKAAAWKQKLVDLPGLKTGIVWRGNPNHKNDKNRSMKAAQIAELAREGVSFINLQKDATQEELSVLRGAFPVFYDASPELHDFTDTAALISTLNLVITVDTSVCHMAGALGAQTYTLLPFVPDWRWMIDRADTPWYPAMRLLRQKKAGDWANVIAETRHDIGVQAASQS